MENLAAFYDCKQRRKPTEDVENRLIWVSHFEVDADLFGNILLRPLYIVLSDLAWRAHKHGTNNGKSRKISI